VVDVRKLRPLTMEPIGSRQLPKQPPAEHRATMLPALHRLLRLQEFQREPMPKPPVSTGSMTPTSLLRLRRLSQSPSARRL
jgi:hypothetical protein